MAKTLRSALVSGSYASLASTAALALAARWGGRGALQPLDATSHWRHGNHASSRRGLDAARTGTGFATNHAASTFWALFFEAWRVWRGPARPAQILAEAVLMGVIAAAVNYGATPNGSPRVGNWC